MPTPLGAIIRVSLTSLLLATLLAGLYVAKHGGDISSLTCTGRNRAGLGPYRHISHPVGPNGYDGQFYYAIAQAPWRTHENEMIDGPAARHLRVLYPALCWLCSGGDPHRLLWAMPAVNALAMAALAGLGAWLAGRRGWSPWWGLTLPIAANVGQPLLHNLTDPLSTLAVAGLLAGWLCGAGPWTLSTCALAGLLCREQNLVVVAIVAAAALWRRQYRTATGLALACLLWGAWVATLWLAYGTAPFPCTGGNFAAPLSGMLYRWQHPGGNDRFSRRLAFFLVGSMLHLTLLLGLAAYLAVRPGSRVVRLSMLAGVGLALVGGQFIYCDFWAYTRVFVWVPLGVWLSAMLTGSRWLIASTLPAALWPLAAALRYA